MISSVPKGFVNSIVNGGILGKKFQAQTPIISIMFSKNNKKIILSLILIALMTFLFVNYFTLGLTLLTAYVVLVLFTIHYDHDYDWPYHINTVNYNWFWKNYNVTITESIINEKVSMESLDNFLDSIKNNNWYIKINKGEKNKTQFILVFRYYEDSIQCKLVM